MRTVKHEEVYLKAYAIVLEAQRGLTDYLPFYNGLRPHQALCYRTLAEVLREDHGSRRRAVRWKEGLIRTKDRINGRSSRTPD